MTRLYRWTKVAVCVFALSMAANAQEKKEPTAAELSKNETPAKAIMRAFEYQEYEFRSAAEAMPAEKWDYRPAAGMFKNEKPQFGPSEVRTFGEQVKHVADHYGQLIIYLRENGIVPPASRVNPPELQEKY